MAASAARADDQAVQVAQAGSDATQTPPMNSAMTPPTAEEIPETVTVTAERTSLVGIATTSSQGEVVQQELQLAPAYRPGQLLETVPGLVVTSHSGEGKANQYLLRGFNLDHGTDLATFLDDVPINQPTHAHGQGYTDLNPLIPELVESVQFTKGPYFADIGDFGSVGSDHITLLDTIDDQASVGVGTFGFQRLFTAGSRAAGSGVVLGALELQHYDGPWVHPDDQRKVNAVVRYSEGAGDNGFSLTAMYYRDLWNATTDQPVRAMSTSYMSSLGLTPVDRFGSLDPTDAGTAETARLSGQYHQDFGTGHFDANVYYVYNRLTLWNDFTHFLIDPVNGDQEAQHENRNTVGGQASYDIPAHIFGIDNDFLAGIWSRVDGNDVSRDATKDRVYLSTTEADRVALFSLAGYIQDTTHWTDWLRTILGVREDYMNGADAGTNDGTASATLFQPKGSLVLGPWLNTEFYVSAGRGLHSDDLRGVTQAEREGIAGAPLIAKSDGAEVGMRSNILPNLAATVTVFQIDFQSETTYDPDVGQDTAGPPSHRYGIEFNTTYQPFDWLEIYTSFAASHARYTEPYDDGTGHLGTYIPNAPDAIASAAAYLRNLGPWSGSIEYRYLGNYPLTSGPCVNSAAVHDFGAAATSCSNAPTPMGQVNGKGYGELNLEGNYAFGAGWKAGVGIYNLLDTHGNAAEFYYVDRLPGEPPAGMADLHIHPLEPRAFHFTVSKTF
jgi:hypothetical protein